MFSTPPRKENRVVGGIGGFASLLPPLAARHPRLDVGGHGELAAQALGLEIARVQAVGIEALERGEQGTGARRVVHIERDADHPTNRGTLCPKGAGLLDYVHSPSRLKYPEVREPGSKEWKRISWDEALTRVAKHMKADRDANFQTKNDAGTTVNRWTTTGFLMCSSSSNESSYLTVKVARGLGMVGIDTQARV